MKIVIVEDEGMTALFLKQSIEEFGHHVVGVFDEGNALFLFLEGNEVDVIFMDIQLNGTLNGIQIADLIHHKFPHISFIFLTSHKDSDTIQKAKVVRPKGYLMKPVVDKDIETILMIVDIEEQSVEPIEKDEIHIGPYIYNVNHHTIYHGNTHIALTKNEYLCIKELISHRDKQVSIEQLLYSIWGEDINRSSSLRELIYRLRKKLSDITIENIPNIGYMLRTV